MRSFRRTKIAIIGLGYVGLPLAVEFGKKYSTIGFDIDSERIRELRLGRDSTLESNAIELASAKKLKFTADPKKLSDCGVFIVTVPTPIDRYKRPDLTPLISASHWWPSGWRSSWNGTSGITRCPPLDSLKRCM
jgi:UDP-N-acetyl-D-galactosamine dehydrogenase